MRDVAEAAAVVAKKEATVNNVMITINYSNITLKLTLKPHG